MQRTAHDLIVVGGGPAGLTAATYAARSGLKTLVLEKGIAGGTAAQTDRIENFPGFPDGINGAALGELMKQQCQRFGATFDQAEVASFRREEEFFLTDARGDEFIATSVIVATGTTPRRLGVPGEAQLLGRGVSHCATCDGPLFRGRDITVIGTGNSGLQEGLFLLSFARTVTFIEYLPRITGDQILQQRLAHDPRVTFLVNHEVVAIQGESQVSGIEVQDRMTAQRRTIPTHGVFVYVGLLPNSGCVQGFAKTDPEGYVITDEDMHTSIRGLFAAGDVRAKRLRQVVTACGDGAIAAISAYHYCRPLTGP